MILVCCCRLLRLLAPDVLGEPLVVVLHHGALLFGLVDGVAEAFVQYLFTPEAQAEFTKVGYRPLEASADKQKEGADKFPAVKTLGTVESFGGWNAAQKKFFEDQPGARQSLVAQFRNICSEDRVVVRGRGRPRKIQLR